MSKKISQIILIFTLSFGWIFSGWPLILSYAQEATTPEATSTPESLINEIEEEEAPAEEVAPVFSAPSEPSPPALKERKLNKKVRLDKNASHSCAAKNFSVNLSGQNQASIELEFNGLRSDTEDIEIGSLPLGIDITFFNNANYSFSPRRSDNGAVLQITNQPGSQKGNFSIPIIYTSGNSETICQINIINL
ncbi:MAG: hypothetical protein Q7S12_00090 [bacterium]|nr:hypothetical protein [bacterium]